jgi:hypothetical protein
MHIQWAAYATHDTPEQVNTFNLQSEGKVRAEQNKNFLTFRHGDKVLSIHRASAERTKGSRTNLQMSRINVPTLPRHGQSIGQTRFVLSSEPGRKELFSKSVRRQLVLYRIQQKYQNLRRGRCLGNAGRTQGNQGEGE